MGSEGFLRRWSRLKGGDDALAPPAEEPEAGVADVLDAPVVLPTLEDAASLTPESDYSAFVAPGVDQAVRRLALQKLFADPHFNRMDGLDIYISDYNRSEPLTASMLAALRQAQGFLQQTDIVAEEQGAGQGGDEDGRQVAGDSGSLPPQSPTEDNA